MKKSKGGVAWTVPGRKRPFAYSTKATSDLIVVLYEQFGDLRQVYDAINYDADAKAIVKAYIDKGIYQINIK